MRAGFLGVMWGVRGSLRMLGSPGDAVSQPVPAALTLAPAGGTALHSVCLWVAEFPGVEQLPG